MDKKTKLFESYSQLMQLQDEHKVFPSDLPLPELLIVGEQSSGKSSLLEFYIGFPCNYVAPGTGTRCPIRFHLSTSRPANIPAGVCKVGMDVIPNDGLAARIEEEMKKIGATSAGFSSEVLSISIYNAKMNAVLLDLPGMIPNPTQDAQAQRVLDIITDKMNANKNCSIIALVEANRHWDNAISIGQLNKLWEQKKLRLPWQDRAIIVGTKLDTVTVSNSDNLTSGLETDTGAIRPNYMAVSLNPESRKRSDCDYANWAQYLTEIADKEEAFIQGKLRTIVSPWKHAWDDHLGLNKTKHLIEDLLMKSLEQCLAELIHDMQAKLDAAKKEIESTQENIDLLDPEKRKQTYLLMYEKYMSRLRRLYIGDSFLVKGKEGHACVLNDKTSWAYFKSVDSIKKDFGGEIPQLQLASFEKKLFGGAHLRRLTSFFRVLIAAAEYSDYPLEKLLQFEGGVGTNNQWNYEKIVFEGVKYTIHQWFHDGLTWLGDEVRASLTLLHQLVVGDMPGLPFTISKIFQESLDMFVENAVSKLQDEVAKKCAFQIHDLPWLMSVTPNTISSVLGDASEIEVDDQKMKDFIAKQQQVDSKQVVKLITHRFPFYVKANRYEDDPEELTKYLNQHIKQLCTTLKILLLIDIEFGIESRINQKVHNPNMSDNSNKKFEKDSLPLRLVKGVWDTDASLDTAALDSLVQQKGVWEHIKKTLEDSIRVFQTHAGVHASPASHATNGGKANKALNAHPHGANGVANGHANHHNHNGAANNTNVNNNTNANNNNGVQANNAAANNANNRKTFTAPASSSKKLKQLKPANLDDANFKLILSTAGKSISTNFKGKDSVLHAILQSSTGPYKDVSELRKAVHAYTLTATNLPPVAKSTTHIEKLARDDAELGIEFLLCYGIMADRPIYVYTTETNQLTCYEVTTGSGTPIGLALTQNSVYQIVTDK